MQLIDWIIILAVVLILVAFYCGSQPAGCSLTERARHWRGTRLALQATIALWAALLTFERSLMSPGDLPFINPLVALGTALLLTLAGCVWSIQGRRLLRQHRMFRAS